MKETVKKIILEKKLNLEEIPGYNEYYEHKISAKKFFQRVADEYGIDVDGLQKKYARNNLKEMKAAFVFVCQTFLQLKDQRVAESGRRFDTLGNNKSV